jgi:hypothetical protein
LRIRPEASWRGLCTITVRPPASRSSITVSVNAPVAGIVARIAASLVPPGTITGDGRLTG